MSARGRAPFAAALAASLALAACSTPPDERFVARPPDRASFPPVAAFLVHRCGSLDCHGKPSRNLRLYGALGLRFSSSGQPLTGATTDDENEQDYQSVVGLEPELISAVVAEGGARPERLTLVRKARGLESHKGNALVQAGDAQDLCFSSWLAGATNAKACADALLTP